LPAKDATAAVTTVAGKYTIVHTQEMDQYEKGAMAPGLAAAVPAPPAGDTKDVARWCIVAKNAGVQVEVPL